MQIIKTAGGEGIGVAAFCLGLPALATSGEIDITEITATTITGGASFAYDANNSLNGQFAATVCP